MSDCWTGRNPWHQVVRCGVKGKGLYLRSHVGSTIRFPATRVRSQWITGAVPGHLLLDVHERLLTFEPHRIFRALFRRPVTAYSFGSIVGIRESQYIENVIIGRSPAMRALTLQLSDREVWFVPRRSRFEDTFAAVDKALNSDEDTLTE